MPFGNKFLRIYAIIIGISPPNPTIRNFKIMYNLQHMWLENLFGSDIFNKFDRNHFQNNSSVTVSTYNIYFRMLGRPRLTSQINFCSRRKCFRSITNFPMFIYMTLTNIGYNPKSPIISFSHWHTSFLSPLYHRPYLLSRTIRQLHVNQASKNHLYSDDTSSGIRTRDPMQHSPQAKLRVRLTLQKGKKRKPFKFLVHLQGFEPGTH